MSCITVNYGDTQYSLLKKHPEFKGHLPAELQAGKTYCLPKNKPVAKNAQNELRGMDSSHYVVKEGDSLGKIAEKLGISKKDLIAFNKGLDPDKIKIGQKLNLLPQEKSKEGKPKEQAKSENKEKLPKDKKYTVQKGDSLGKIAEKFGIPTNIILANNPGIKANKIKVGDVINLNPEKPKEKFISREELRPLVKEALDII